MVSSKNYDGFGFSIKPNEQGAQAIAFVEPNSPCEKAGIKENDLILKINDINVSNIGYSQLLLILQSECKKKCLKLEIQRIDSSLGRKNSLHLSKHSLSDNSLSILNESYNLSLHSNDSIEHQKNKISYYNIKRNSDSTPLGIKLGPNGKIGLIVQNSLADKAGMKTNQRIVEINGIDFSKKTKSEIHDFVRDKKDLDFGVKYEINEEEKEEVQEAEEKSK